MNFNDNTIMEGFYNSIKRLFTSDNAPEQEKIENIERLYDNLKSTDINEIIKNSEEKNNGHQSKDATVCS